MTSLEGHLLRSTAFNLAGRVVTLGVAFALTPFIVHELGATDFGLWVLVASLVAYGTLLDVGVGAAVTKYVAELRAAGKADDASSLVSTALRLYGGLGLVAFLLSIPVAFLFPVVFEVPPDRHDVARWLVLITGFTLGLELPATTIYAVMRGLHRFDLINVVSVGASLSMAAGTVVVLLLGGGVLGMALVVIPLTLLWQIPMYALARRAAPDLRLRWKGARRDQASTIASFSGFLFVINGAGMLKTKTDELVIGAALPTARVAPYALARRLSDIPQQLTYQFVRVLFPLASRLQGEQDEARLRSLFIGSTRVTLGLFVPLAGGLMVLAEPFLTAWVGAEYARDASIVLILVAAGLLDMVSWPGGSMLQGTGHHRAIAFMSGGSALLNLALSIALVGPLGVTGVALGTLIATALEAAVMLPYAMRVHRVSPLVALREALLPGLVPAVPMILALLALRDAFDPSTLPAVAGVGLVGVLVYAAGYLCFRATAAERRMVMRLAGRGAEGGA